MRRFLLVTLFALLSVVSFGSNSLVIDQKYIIKDFFGDDTSEYIVECHDSQYRYIYIHKSEMLEKMYQVVRKNQVDASTIIYECYDIDSEKMVSIKKEQEHDFLANTVTTYYFTFPPLYQGDSTTRYRTRKSN